MACLAPVDFGIILFHFTSISGTIILSCLLVYTQENFGFTPSICFYLLLTNISQTCHEHAASTARLFVTPVHGSPKYFADTGTLQLLTPMHACGVSRNVVSILQKTHYKDMVSVEVEQIGVTS
jgi:hypothetical protein